VTAPRQRLGAAGERLAADYLERHGHRILERNVRTRAGEIDLVTLDGSTLVVVEVKLRRPSAFGAAREALSPAKQRRLAALAGAYAAAHPELPPDVRIDLVAIELAANGAIGAIDHVVGAVDEPA
jgi:putative endonuclease